MEWKTSLMAQSQTVRVMFRTGHPPLAEDSREHVGWNTWPGGGLQHPAQSIGGLLTGRQPIERTSEDAGAGGVNRHSPKGRNVKITKTTLATR